MKNSRRWTRRELLVALNLYCQIPFGKLHLRNPEIIKFAGLLDKTPSALAMKLANIASLDLAVTSSGRTGLKGASSADRTMWEEMQNNWQEFAEESEETIRSMVAHSAVDEILPPEKDSMDSTDYSGKNKIVEAKSRIGQPFFRRAVHSAYGGKCCITGLSIGKLLVASHIKPWSVDESNRLNPRNGLLLSALHDKAFDLGIITINEDMTVRISSQKPASEDSFFDYSIRRFAEKPIALPEKFIPNPDFLAYHRENIFIS